MSETPEEKMRMMPSNWWQYATALDVLVKPFRSHLVGLLLAGRVNGEYSYYVYTGFLLHHKTKLLWLTAGHAVSNIADALSSQNFKVSKMEWLDGCEIQGAETVLVYRPQLIMKSWESEGLDFGAIVIPFLNAHSLLANKQIAGMEERIWRNLKQAQPEGYYVIGYPRAMSDFKETPMQGNKVLMSLKADLTCLPIQPINRPDDVEGEPFWNDPDAFYGRILQYPDWPAFQAGDIAGVSGGPILSIERTPNAQFAYRLVGIQSEWLPASGIVRAEPIGKIAAALEHWP